MSSVFVRDGVELFYTDTGSGMPVLFQHGLGGDDGQVADIYPPSPQTRRVTLECRGQGRSAYGPQDALSIKCFSDDLVGLTETLGIAGFVAGGISMGAAIALRLAVRQPDRVRALVLARPAWVTQCAPSNMRPYELVGDLLLNHPPEKARQLFEESETAAELRRFAPDNLASLMGFFQRSEPHRFGTVLKSIAVDGPRVSEDELRRISVPALIIGHESDLAHPLAFAKELAELLPGSRLDIITPKAVDRDAYRRDFRLSLSTFLDTIV
jgi:pimeloyl-ACP methyl ester carboxylesterase